MVGENHQTRLASMHYLVSTAFLMAMLDSWTISSLNLLVSVRSDSNSSDWE
jgi:hypothetical protein